MLETAFLKIIIHEKKFYNNIDVIRAVELL